MTALSFAWVDADGGDPPWVHVTLTPTRVRASVLSAGKSVSTKPIEKKSTTGAGTMTVEPGPYNCTVKFGDPVDGRYTGAGWISKTPITIAGSAMDLRDALQAAQVTPPPNWVAVLGEMELMPKAVADATYAPRTGTVMYVTVRLGNEPRPYSDNVVFWIGGSTQPINMMTGDVWFSEPPPPEPPALPQNIVSAFAFAEGAGNATSAIGSYSLTPSGASWGGGSAAGPFVGALGTGAESNWWVSMDVRVTAFQPSDFACLLYVPADQLWMDYDPSGMLNVWAGGGVTVASALTPGVTKNITVAHTGGTTAGSNTTRVYINGELAATQTHSEAFNPANWAGAVQIGKGAGDYDHNGTIDNLRFGAGTITDAEAAAVAVTPVA